MAILALETSAISFGALARAQQTLTGQGEETTIPSSRQDPTLASLRQSLRDANRRTPNTSDVNGTNNRVRRATGGQTVADMQRSSKHAPTELSSKKAISRRRDIVVPPKRNVRDPRFESVGGPLDEPKTKSTYAFLETYREDEITQIREDIKRSKDEFVTEKLKRELLAMESRRQATRARSQRQEVLRRHRAKEKELVRQGKKPFYLKKAEQKKMALVDRYENMKPKEVDRLVARKRKREASKAKRGMPWARRNGQG
ncbi:MAG: rRNA biogenesis protein rrp36 [Caeruleum heppii]|nr:MAG: rRNA biogenesis protein rrp36 [Caeruleum heppii]